MFLLRRPFSDSEAISSRLIVMKISNIPCHSACCRSGELGGDLSEEYRRETANRVQWGPMKAMRNMVAHGYGKMDRRIIWETVTTDIPVLKAVCEEQLNI